MHTLNHQIQIEGFDDLHQPEGILLELQKKAAELCGAEESFYLVNGSTGGILSAVSAALPAGPCPLRICSVSIKEHHLSAVVTIQASLHLGGTTVRGHICFLIMSFSRSVSLYSLKALRSAVLQSVRLCLQADIF